MGIIPKIKVGLSAKKRETLKIGFDCATTASIGSIQPTLCREMVPNETFKVDVSSLVRLAPLAVPTFGRMSLRHYHAFVPYHSIWDQFDCMLSASNYTNGSTTWIPSSSPSIKGKNLFCRLLRYMDFTIYKGYDLDEDDAVTFNPIGMTLAQAQEYVTTYIKPAYNALVNGYLFKTVGGTDSSYQLAQDRGSLVGNLADDGYGVLNLGGFYQTLVGTPVFNPTSTGNNRTTTRIRNNIITSRSRIKNRSTY